VKISKRLREALSPKGPPVFLAAIIARVSAVGAGFYLSAVATMIGGMVEIGLKAKGRVAGRILPLHVVQPYNPRSSSSIAATTNAPASPRL
jgi:hypothetical protein